MRYKRIYWFAYYTLASPSVRYRAYYPLQTARENFHIEYMLIMPGYSPSNIYRFLKAYVLAFFGNKESLIVIQRIQSRFVFASLLKLLVRYTRCKCIYDLDDADYLIAHPKTIYHFAKSCDQVHAGSEAIKNHLSAFNPNTIFLSSPTPDLKILTRVRNSPFTIGWVGEFGGGHKSGLHKLVLPALKSLDFDCRLIMLGLKSKKDKEDLQKYFSNSPRLQLDLRYKVNWLDEEGIQQTISEFDLGLATLINDPIQIAKSGIKVKQYFNNGVPALCNKLPENSRFLKHEVNGLFCENADEFEVAIRRFYTMSDQEYWRFSRNARASIAEFNHENYLNQLLISNAPHTSPDNTSDSHRK